MYTFARLLILVLFSTLLRAQEEGSTIELKIENISDDEGQMLIGLYDSEETWLETPKIGMFGQIENGKSAVSFKGIPDGTYAISVFHDEDNDGKLDSFLGIPTEDTGCSNNAPANFGPPKWVDAKFEVKGGTVKQVINLK